MKEDKIYNLRQMDANLREAIQQEENERPLIPVNLNAQILQKVNQKKNVRKHQFVIWPCIAAACVAAAVVIFLIFPNETENIKPQQIVKTKVEKHKVDTHKVAPHTPVPQDTFVASAPKMRQSINPSIIKEVTKAEKANISSDVDSLANILIAQTNIETDTPILESNIHDSELAVVTKEKTTNIKSELDIPISNPQQLRYTPEELALMKRQAREAYIKWVQLEMVIINNEIEAATAQY